MTIRYKIHTAVGEANVVASLCQDLIQELARLIAKPIETEGWLKARALLAALPLTTSEYAISVNRLNSAATYTSCRELGAARFELTQLTRKLASLARVYDAHLDRRGNQLPATSDAKI